MKYPQHILAFKAEAVFEACRYYLHNFGSYMATDGVYDLGMPCAYDKLFADNGMAVVMRRQELEKDEEYLQPLPYTVFRVKSMDDGKTRYLVYKRPDKGEGESRLAGQLSMGIGGHVDLEDLVIDKGVIDLIQTINRNTRREKNEEISIAYAPANSGNLVPTFDALHTGLLILERSADVHRVHVGIVMLVDLQIESTSTFKFECIGDGNTFYGLFTAEELHDSAADEVNYSNFEMWTKRLITNLQFEMSPLHPDNRRPLSVNGLPSLDDACRVATLVVADDSGLAESHHPV